MRDSLFTSNISCRGNTNLDCKPVRCSYATVEWATLYSNSHYTGRAEAHLRSKPLKLSVASQTTSHPGPTCPPVSEARGGEKAWIHPSTCRAEAQAHSARPWQHGQLRSPGLRFGCLSLSLYIKVESRKNTPERERERQMKAGLLSGCETTELNSCKLCRSPYGLLCCSPSNQICYHCCCHVFVEPTTALTTASWAPNKE